MREEDLKWNDLKSEVVLKCPIMEIRAKDCESATGVRGHYYVLDARNWVVILPVKDGKFIMVRQWRHGSNCMTTEFPGGTGNAGEDPMYSASREMEEEIGYRAGKMTKLGEVNPNPALFSNCLHVYLAEELTDLGHQNLDKDEFINCVEVPIEEVIKNYGSGEYIHAFMGTALSFYQRYISENK